MQKIGDTTKTADSNGEFTDGDPQKQISCTWIMAPWLNTLQREVIKVVESGGLKLNPKDDTQLYQAIEKLIGNSETDLKSKTLRQIRLPAGAATHWLKIASMIPAGNAEVRLEVELSGMSDYGADASGMAVDRVYMTTRRMPVNQRVTSATVGTLIQQFTLARSVDTAMYRVGVTEEVSNGTTTRYNFWLQMTNHSGISSTMSLLNNTTNGVTVTSDFSGVNATATEPAGIVYAVRERFFTTANPPTAAQSGALPVYPDALTADLNTLGATEQAGVYCQTLNAGATDELHYPIKLAGSLLLTPSAYGCQQEYTEFTAGRKFQRSLTAAWNGKDGPWSAWREYYGDSHKPTPDEINAVKKTGDTMSGQLITPSVATTPDAMPNGAGAYADQLSLQAPFFQPNWQWPVNSGGIFVPIAKGTSTRKDKGYPTAVSYGYLMPANNEHAHPTIHAKGDSNVDCVWDFNPYNGNVSSKAGTFATQEWVNTHCPFPVGYVMLMGNNVDPRAVYPGTDWQDLNGTYDGRVLSLGYDPLGTGGSNQVTLGVEHLPPHSHNLKAYHSNTSLDGGWSSRYSVDPSNGAEANDVVTSTGGGQSFNVTNAYVHVRGWMRTA